MPLRLLLQRLDDDPDAPCRAHLDLACDDVAAEQDRHEALGAVVVRQMPNWTTLPDPTRLAYCVTRRNPSTGTLKPASQGPFTVATEIALSSNKQVWLLALRANWPRRLGNSVPSRRKPVPLTDVPLGPGCTSEEPVRERCTDAPVRGPWAPAGKRAGRLGRHVRSRQTSGPSAVTAVASAYVPMRVSLSPASPKIGMATPCG
jgi:hypothetical protein